MKIFFISQRLPFPPDRGDRIATYNQIRHLSRNHEVHVFCLTEDGDPSGEEAAEALHASSVNAVRQSKRRAQARAMAAIAGRRSLSVAYFDVPELHRSVQRRFREIGPDLVFVFSGNMAQYAEPFVHVPRVMQFMELDSLKWRDYARHATMPMRWIYGLEATRLLAYERHVANSFDRSLVCTPYELGQFRELIPTAAAYCVPNGVDTGYFSPLGRPKERFSMVFSGVMDYFPNVDGVVWFCTDILPHVRRICPAARITICGASPTPEVMALGRDPLVTVTRRVPDVRPHLDAAEVGVVPLRLARGIQNKLLEAMAMGLPCVTTTAAWRGTDLADGDGVLVADEPERFAEHVVRLLRDDAWRAQLGRRARSAVVENYAWDRQLQSLDAILDDVCRSR